MPKVTSVKKAQPSKHKRFCITCQTEIKPGDAYKHASLKTGPRSSRTICWCSQHNPKASQLTSSQHLGTIYAGQEAFADDVSGASTVDEVADALRNAAESIREAAESYRESASNIEEGFGHPTSLSEELEGKADEVESWCDEIDSTADSLEEFDEDAARGEAEEEVRDELEAEHADALKELNEREEDETFSTPDLDTLQALADALDLDMTKIEELVEEKINDKRDDAVSTAIQTAEGIINEVPV